VLAHAWQKQLSLQAAEIRGIDAEAGFGAAVEACLLVADFSPAAHCDFASVYPLPRNGRGRVSTSTLVRPESAEVQNCQSNSLERIAWRDGHLIANLDHYARWHHLCADGNDRRTTSDSSMRPIWRSGVKHDCADVLELEERDGRLRNKLGDEVVIESDYLYPLLKSGDLKSRTSDCRRWLLLPQRFLGEDTSRLETEAPQTWRYLQSHAVRLDSRRSSIYRRQPRFAVFGVGEYTFAMWKVAVSGLAKQLRFVVVANRHERPVLLDDASYFLPCESEQDAETKAELLNSLLAREFFSAFVFWDAKRPITAEILRRLDLNRLASAVSSS
jgi:hypothetical protein